MIMAVYPKAKVVMDNLDRLLEDLQQSVSQQYHHRQGGKVQRSSSSASGYGRIEKSKSHSLNSAQVHRSKPQPQSAQPHSPSVSPGYYTIGLLPSTHIPSVSPKSPRRQINMADTNGTPASRRNLSELEDLISDLDRAKSTTTTKTTKSSMKSVVIKEEGKKYVDEVDRPDVECIYEGSKRKGKGTDEMADLMEQMKGFKMNSANSPRPMVNGEDSGDYGKIKRPKSPAIRTSGHCSSCEKAIVGQVVTALNKQWHIQCFCCSRCGRELGTRNFFERDGKPYCEPDYHELFSPRCAYCGGAILDKCITALNKNWHPDHFFCAQCGNPFGEDGFHEKDGEAYCKDDFFRLFAPKCKGCSQPIHENYISALNAQWHSECFVCRDCGLIFTGGSFFDYEGMPYCEIHYHAKRGSLCAACQKPITGKCITAMFQKFHPEHFVCSFCLKQLNKGTFKEDRNKPYCHSCFEKLH